MGQCPSCSGAWPGLSWGVAADMPLSQPRQGCELHGNADTQAPSLLRNQGVQTSPQWDRWESPGNMTTCPHPSTPATHSASSAPSQAFHTLHTPGLKARTQVAMGRGLSGPLCPRSQCGRDVPQYNTPLSCHRGLSGLSFCPSLERPWEPPALPSPHEGLHPLCLGSGA